MQKDRGMSLRLRVVILITVVLLSVVAIMVASVLTRLYHDRKHANKHQWWDDDDFLQANGYLPQSRQSFASSRGSVANGDAFYVRSHRKSRSSTGTVTSPSSISAKDTPIEGALQAFIIVFYFIVNYCATHCVELQLLYVVA